MADDVLTVLFAVLLALELGVPAAVVVVECWPRRAPVLARHPRRLGRGHRREIGP